MPKKFKIYEIPGVKIGATEKWPQRVIDQGYKEEDCNVLFETDELKLASSMERVLQKKHGYPLDRISYERIYELGKREWNKEEREKAAKQTIISNKEITSDPIRYNQRSHRMSKANAEIANDPIKSVQRSQRMSAASNQDIITKQVDPSNGITIGVLKSTAIASWLMDYKCSDSIQKAKKTGKIRKGFLWK